MVGTDASWKKGDTNDGWKIVSGSQDYLLFPDLPNGIPDVTKMFPFIWAQDHFHDWFYKKYVVLQVGWKLQSLHKFQFNEGYWESTDLSA